MAQKLSNLPVGAKVKFGKYTVNNSSQEPIVWRVVAKNHNSTGSVPYPNDSITLLSDKIIDVFCYDAKEPNSPVEDRATYGNSWYTVSNIDQWLNSSSYDWYQARHTYDQSPNNASYIGVNGTAILYANRPGFLYYFNDYEKRIIQDTSLATNYPAQERVEKGSNIEYFSRKVFLPSGTELSGKTLANLDTGLDTQWEYFKTNGYYATVSQQWFDNTTLNTTYKPSKVNTMYQYWTRSVLGTGNGTLGYIKNDGTYYEGTPMACKNDCGVRPAINLAGSTTYVSIAVDSDGCYVVNSAPSTPTGLSIYTMSMYEGYAYLIGGDNIKIRLGASNDSDNDAITYVVDALYYSDGHLVTRAEVYRGTSLECIVSLPKGFSHVEYSVKAIDSIGLESSSISNKLEIKNYNAPTITMSSNIGVKSEPFSLSYTISDAEGEVVERKVTVDGKVISWDSYQALGTYTIDFTGETWLKLANGTHTVEIYACDQVSEYPQSTTQTCVFTKNVTTFTVQNTTPMEASSMPTRIALMITQVVPSGATSKIEVCNNAFDSSPTWEDATESITNGFVHMFSNRSKTDNRWGVAVRVTLDRGEAVGVCYISSIGGNFE